MSKVGHTQNITTDKPKKPMKITNCTIYVKQHFDSLKQAEKYLNKLYSKYDHVRLISSPMFTEAGVYTFEIK